MGKRKTGNGSVVSLIPGGKNDEMIRWDEWCVPATDAKGHSEKVWVRVPGVLKAMCQQIFDSKKYPYRSVGFVYRHALYALIKHLDAHPEYEGGVGSTIHALNATIEISRNNMYFNDYTVIMQGLEEQVIELSRRGKEGENQARRLVRQVWAQVMQVEDEFWRREFESELKRRYDRLLNGMGEGEGEE